MLSWVIGKVSDYFDDFIGNTILLICYVLMAGLIFTLGVGIYEELRPPHITDGVITELNHEEEYSEVILMPMSISNGNSTTTIMQPTYIHYPETFEVVIENGDKKEDFYIKEKAFKNLKVGERFKFDGDTMKNKRPKETRDATPEEEKQLKGEG